MGNDAAYWKEKYEAVVEELQKHTIVSDAGQFRNDVVESIRGLAEERDGWKSFVEGLEQSLEKFNTTKFWDQVDCFNAIYKLNAAPSPRAATDEELLHFKSILLEEIEECDDILKLQEPLDRLVALADWLADIVVYCSTKARLHGLPMPKILNAIMQSNFSKLGDDGLPIYDHRKKVIKGPNFSPPEPAIKKLLLKPPRTALIGQTFERLKVLHSAVDGPGGLDRWLCECECGQYKVISGKHLKRGTKSCGCYRREVTGDRVRKEPGRSGLHALFCRYRRRASTINVDFELTETQLESLVTQICHYCGTPPYALSINSPQGSEARKEHSKFLYNGLDRKDSDRGYTLDNVVPCCKRCNFGKHEMTQEEFSTWLDLVQKHWKR